MWPSIKIKKRHNILFKISIMVILVRNISDTHVGIFEIVEFLNQDNISRNLCNKIKQITKCWCKVKNMELSLILF